MALWHCGRSLTYINRASSIREPVSVVAEASDHPRCGAPSLNNPKSSSSCTHAERSAWRPCREHCFAMTAKDACVSPRLLADVRVLHSLLVTPTLLRASLGRATSSSHHPAPQVPPPPPPRQCMRSKTFLNLCFKILLKPFLPHQPN